jgi:aminoglycoside phosphotransferase family enzyme/predicted kinase
MELPRLIELLSNPAVYPYMPPAVKVIQTHISAVFLAGEFVYKLKKPVALGFLDFTTLDKRLAACHAEVRLNRRLAPDVYLGVVPITRLPDGVRVEGEGDIVEWAVKMRRLPDESTLLQRVRAGQVDADLIEAVARRIAAFHLAAERNQRIASFARFDVVARNFREVFDRAEPFIGETAGRSVFNRVRSGTEEALARLRPLIEQRADRGAPRDCHGDLHLDHIYYFPDRPAPGDLVVIDCIEFNERFRFIDPVADMAFVAMDLAFYARRDLARAFAGAYFAATGEEDGPALLPLYSAYRAAIRGMVDGLLLGEAEVPAAEREAARSRARAHWLLALGELEPSDRRPGLLLVGGLPGSGKSTLARELGECAGFEVIRSDVVRKELADLPVNEPSPPQARDALYSPDSTDRTYTECLLRAERLLAEGQRVIVDATFRDELQRQRFVEAAVRYGARVGFIVCRASPETVRQRLEARKGDASDAGWDEYQRAAGDWEEPGAGVSRVLDTIATEGAPQAALKRACETLRRVGLLDG